MKPLRTLLSLFVLGGLLASAELDAQVTYDRILAADDEPENWLTYNGNYSSQRHSGLEQITRDNVDDLEMKWMLQNQTFGAWQSNPIVVDGIMYITERPNDVMAVDAVTGRVFWLYRHTPSEDASVCCGANNKDTTRSAAMDTIGLRIDMGSPRRTRKGATSGHRYRTRPGLSGQGVALGDEWTS